MSRDVDWVEERTMRLRQEAVVPLAPRQDRFERMVDPDGTLTRAERKRRADRERTRHYRDLAEKRWAKTPAKQPARRKRRRIDPTVQDAWIFERYGLTGDDYAAMLVAQHGGCALCKAPPSPDRPLDVDHDHRCCAGEKTCGRCVRGLLCVACNTGIGAYERMRPYIAEVNSYVDRTPYKRTEV